MTPLPETDILTRTGNAIRKSRQASGLNLHELARLTGISASALSLIETGKRDPRLGTLDRIARALNVPLAEFFGAPSPDTSGASPEQDGYDLSDFK